MTTGELNAALRVIAEQDTPLLVNGLRNKSLPCIGAYWHDLVFEEPFSVGHFKIIGRVINSVCLDAPEDWKGFVAQESICAATRMTSAEESAALRALCEALAAVPSEENAQALFDYLQGLSI